MIKKTIFISSFFLASYLLPAQNRIVSLGGIMTETICALGGESKLIGVDISSVYPESVQKLPQVGYWRGLSAEGVISLKPDMVIATYDAGPESVLKQIKASGAELVILPPEFTFEGAKQSVIKIGEKINKQAKAKEITQKMDAEYKRVLAKKSKLKKAPKTLFIYIRGGKIFNAGGELTPADAMIALAGGINVGKAVKGWKNVGAEFFLQANPEVVIVTDLGLESMGGLEKFKALPGISASPAVKNNRIIIVDDLEFLGFGPRFTNSLEELVDYYSKIK